MISQELRLGSKQKAYELKNTIKNILKAEQRVVFNDENSNDISKNLLLFLTEKENIEGDLKFDSNISSFFTLHFFKQKDTKASNQNKNTHTCKNHKLRGEVKSQANEIISFRNKYPKFAKHIRGIDAASSETNARPEVFAQAFRMLKNHQLRDNETLLKNYVVNNPLNITFHAGEDFFDIVDGLRYIDECLTFLDMQNGDRLGHAIALGIDVQKYYALKKHKLLISKHTLLDNLSWTLSAIHKFGMKDHLSEAYRLENLFKALYSEVYIANIQRNKKVKS
ncbi:hypothetical protein OKW96_20455 [Sphingobacterium sp. KU25419]|nr:hypothetical protein OKW96_20455 [Sphingobacterium sp. KU25419]